jgi:glyoxylase-like metal-dependent hydrolase (beta-lactamase superfamily II)/8-oxo-dGTP pyrophosphatase MutT (NUDIX family)
MVRAQFQLHPARIPSAPLPAATVLLLRDTQDGIEVLMTRRSLQASFAPGAYVFPGGGIDAADANCHHLAQRRPTQDDVRLTQAIAAIRESFEELGVLLAKDAVGKPVSSHTHSLLSRSENFAEQCLSHGLTLSANEVYVLAHWVTDRDLPRRFDVPFLVARMPEQQEPVADEKEQFEPVWVSPSLALSRHTAGDFFIIFPTIRTLEKLQSYTTVDSVLAACANEQPWFHSCPRAGLLHGKEVRFMEHEPPFGELALTCPDGQIVHHLDWQSHTVVPLLAHVRRLTAPNPSMMTGPGTNSYLIGDDDSGYVVVDPGPPDAEHVERLWQACRGHIRAIVCTHSHPDHSPAAWLLKNKCVANGLSVQVMGLPSSTHARPHSEFVPDKVLHDGEEIVLNSNSEMHTLRVIHTPGHAANHLCLVLQEDGLLISGDHVLNGSTTVVDPPDGHMGDYLASLDKLVEACQQWHVQFILPAHGYVLGNLWNEPYSAIDCIQRLKAHRLKREDKVRRAMQALPHGSLQDWLPLAYEDVPEALWPVAMRSLQAHVQHLYENKLS